MVCRRSRIATPYRNISPSVVPRDLTSRFLQKKYNTARKSLYITQFAAVASRYRIQCHSSFSHRNFHTGMRHKSHDSSVGLAMRYGLDGWGGLFLTEERSSLSHSVQTGSEAHPGLFTSERGGGGEVKRQRLEVDRSPSYANLKNCRAILLLPNTPSLSTKKTLPLPLTRCECFLDGP